VSLFFFFFLVFILSHAARNDLHPMKLLFFLACAFFGFTAAAYLADIFRFIGGVPDFVDRSVVLVVSYCAWWWICDSQWWKQGWTQLIYLVLFSYAFFL